MERTIKLTDTEIKTVCRALELLQQWDETHLKMYWCGEQSKKALEAEINRCMIILSFVLAQYEQEE